jgi:hypothetical protein
MVPSLFESSSSASSAVNGGDALFMQQTNA